MTLEEIRSKRAELLSQAQKIEDVAKAETRSYSADEALKMDELLNEYEALEADEKRAERLEVAQRNQSKVVERRSQPLATKSEAANVPANDPFANFRHFLKTGETRDINLGSATKGGNFVADVTVAEMVLRKRNERSFVRELSTIHERDLPSVSLRIPKISTSVTANWAGSENASTSVDTSFAVAAIDMEPQLLTAIPTISRRALDADPNIEQEVMNDVAKAFVNKEQAGFLVGSGQTYGQPLGIFWPDNDGVPTSRDVGVTSGNNLSADKIIDAYYTLEQQYRDQAVWIMNPAQAKAIRKLKDSHGDYLWEKGIAGSPNTILGRPVYESSFAPSATTSGTYAFVFADMSEYHILDVPTLEMQRLDERFADSHDIGYAARSFVNGNPGVSDAFVRGQYNG